jgi:antibiotic biosynthesis monooxygenase (ABM) superfamily enzyme
MVESLAVPFFRICKPNIGRILISSVICLVLHLHFSLPLLIRVFQGWEPRQHPYQALQIIALW